MYLLLKSMGFDTFIVGCSTMIVPLDNNHILVIVRLPSALALSSSDWQAIEGFDSDDLYLIDVGWTQPIPCPVNLNRLPFSYKAAGFEIRFQFNSVAKEYETLLIGGNPLKGAFVGYSFLSFFFKMLHNFTQISTFLPFTAAGRHANQEIRKF